MIRVQDEKRACIAPLFNGIEDSMVIAYLQGYMGDAYVKAENEPLAAVIISGEYSFWGGDSGSADADYLLAHFFERNADDSSIGIFADDKPAWEKALMAHGENNPAAVPRFCIAQKDYDFDLDLLQRYIDALPPGFEMVRFDKRMYDEAMSANWSKEFCETFDSAEDYLKRGFGFAVLKDGEFVSGTSTMTVYDGGTELQVATREDFRRKGLALPCAAAMVKECAERNIRPCWDAANETSKHMALKLGYEYEGVYTTIHMHR
jgi:RimJ/RimL family protein N-acetyltransferase